MKKEYINPTMEVVNIETMSVLAASDKVGIGSGTKSPGGADSRNFDPYWDDEEW